MSDTLKPLIDAAANGPLSRAQAQTAFEILFAGEATPSQIGGLLMALRTRGETVDEYAAAAAVMRAKCNAVKAPEGAMDIVGTGGDGKGTLNISTATAFVVAGAGVPEDTPIGGTPDGAEFTEAILGNRLTLDVVQARRDLNEAARALTDEATDLGAIVLECTNMCPYAADIELETGLPVYSIYDFVCWFQSGLRPKRFPLP